MKSKQNYINENLNKICSYFDNILLCILLCILNILMEKIYNFLLLKVNLLNECLLFY